MAPCAVDSPGESVDEFKARLASRAAEARNQRWGIGTVILLPLDSYLPENFPGRQSTFFQQRLRSTTMQACMLSLSRLRGVRGGQGAPLRQANACWPSAARERSGKRAVYPFTRYYVT
jgi:hypothetical protein